MSPSSFVSRSLQWFRRSGIQESNGGVARYYRADLERNAPVSTEITGYTLSTLVYLGEMEQARTAARFLVERAWDGRVMPFEIEPANFTYFFDCGIIVRGLLACWRATGETQWLDAAASIGKAMGDFWSAEGDCHPILELPHRQAIARDPLRWSRSAGCYQLKSALAWWELFEITGEAQFCEWYERVLADGLRSYASFLPGHPEQEKVVDRLHAFLYFLEGLLPRVEDRRCAAAVCDGLRRVSSIVAESASLFERADVCAQLLRMRVYAEWAGVAPLDASAAQEADTLAGFQAASSDPRIDGGFYFGRKSGAWLPHVSPVSTAFAVQALALWAQARTGGPQAGWQVLI